MSYNIYRIINSYNFYYIKVNPFLIQISNIETDQLKPHYREANIVEYTQELASDFKNIAKKLVLVYNIDIPSPEEFNKAAGDKIYLDHDMYETILYNLCIFLTKKKFFCRYNIH